MSVTDIPAATATATVPAPRKPGDSAGSESSGPGSSGSGSSGSGSSGSGSSGSGSGSGLVYFYGIVRDTAAAGLNTISTVDGESGLRGVSHLGLTALVSTASRARYQLSRRNMLGHESAVEAIMAVQDVLPARFGTVISEQKIVKELLKPRYEQLVATLDRISGRIEVGVKISWRDLQLVISGMVANDPVLRSYRDRLNSRTPQRVRLNIGKRVEAALEIARGRESQAAVGMLTDSGICDDVVVNEAIAEEMVLNASFLVPGEYADEFERKVAAFDSESGDRYLIQLISPLPPYSFISFDSQEPQLLESAMPEAGLSAGRTP